MTLSSTELPIGEIENELPLQLQSDSVEVRGWCIGNSPEPPAVRMVIDSDIFVTTTRHKRSDVAALYSNVPSANGNCGFIFTTQLPAGVHLARFQAALPNGTWQTFRIHTIAVRPAPTAGVIENPKAITLTERVHVSGWVGDHGSAVKFVTLRYGHQSIACDLGDTRPDVSSVGNSRAFRSHINLSAGHGPLRLHVEFTDGRTAIVPTDRHVHIDRDENHDGTIDFTASRVPLPRAAVRDTIPLPNTAKSLNILFLLHGSYAANSALHVSSIANKLSSAGHACTIAITQDPETIRGLPTPHFQTVLHADAAHGVPFDDGRGPDIIHAWTPRECVRRLASNLRRHHTRVKLIVHLEDNEQALLSSTLGRPFAELAALPATELDQVVPSDLTHPQHGPAFLASADGITLITESLSDFVPAGRPQLVCRPAADEHYFFPRPRPESFRQLWQRRPDETVLAYPGNVHAANAAEVRELYHAVRQLNEIGQPVTLLRTGRNSVDFLGNEAAACEKHVISLGLISTQRYLPDLLALADIFVQPGLPDDFNLYRFPSKLPEFFALGRPVVLPRANLGMQARHGIDAYVLDRADCAGIVHAVTELRSNQELYDRLARGASEFATRHFSWSRTAEALANFYARLTS